MVNKHSKQRPEAYQVKTTDLNPRMLRLKRDKAERESNWDEYRRLDSLLTFTSNNYQRKPKRKKVYTLERESNV